MKSSKHYDFGSYQPAMCFSKVSLGNGKLYDSRHKMQYNTAFVLYKQTPPSVNVGQSADIRANTAIQTSCVISDQACRGFSAFTTKHELKCMRKETWEKQNPEFEVETAAALPSTCFFVPSVVCFRSHFSNLSDFPFLRCEAQVCTIVHRVRSRSINWKKKLD